MKNAFHEGVEDVYKQEYEAEFLEESAGVFRGIRKCVQGELEGPREDVVYLIGYAPAWHGD